MKTKPTFSWPYFLTWGLSLRTRILLGTLIPIFAVALSFLETLVAQGQFALMTHQILDERIEMMQAAAQIKQSLVSYDDALFRYLAMHDSEQLEEGRLRRSEVLDLTQRLTALCKSPTLAARLALLSQESRQYFQDAGRLLDYARSNGAAVDDIGRRSRRWTREPKEQHLELAFLSEEGRTRLIRVYSLCEEIITVNRMALDQAQGDMQTLQRETRRRAIALSALAVGVLLVVMAGFALSVLVPMGELVSGVRKIEQGELDVHIPVVTPDEVGELTDAFNRATRTIQAQKEQLWRESITDHLTGAYNHRHFRKILSQEIERARRANGCLALLMIDIDHFKRYNDTHGHEFGNEVIRQVSALIRDTLRQGDMVARYGGDELAVLLTDTDLERAQFSARRLLDEIGRIRFPSVRNDAVPQISISIGGAAFPSDASALEDLIEKADEALYAAKRGGRARAHWAGKPEPLHAL